MFATRCCVVLCVASTGGCRPSATEEPPARPAVRGCTEIGCGPVFLLDFDYRSRRHLGVHRIELTVDGESFTCERQLPLHCDDPPACPRDDVQLVEIGCALDASEQDLGGVQFLSGTPKSIQIAVFENDVPIGSGSYDLEYASSRPNGPQCEPVCTQARNETLVLTPEPSPD